MKAAVVREPKASVVLEDRPVPEPKSGEVLIRVHACGVCHSDLMVQQGLFPFAKYPRVPGHEVAGAVEKVGPGVTWPQVGDRVGMPWLFHLADTARCARRATR
jgi:D-arabinose 1-dehydrogenase-like Zn-dependent alcohol dehydrogenase